jgi:hypothetical protein
MMDAKYLAEIRERCELGRPPQQCEVKALLSEVERLTIENLGLKDAAIRCDGYEKRYHAALTELDVKDQQIATLKKAYELACTDLSDRAYPPSNAEQGTKENINFYIHQAQQLTHKTQGAKK